MTTTSLLAVPGTERLSRENVAAFLDMCDRHGWSADAIAAVISLESGWSPTAGAGAWSPSRTASGLLQFIEATAKGLGVTPTSRKPAAVTSGAGDGRAWATWTILGMAISQQIPLVEAYYERTLEGRSPRLVDYYLAAYGSAHIGKPLDAVLSRAGERIYEQNRGLDLDADGVIEVADLDALVRRQQAKAGGARIQLAASGGSGDSQGARARGLVAVVALGVLAAAGAIYGKQTKRLRT